MLLLVVFGVVYALYWMHILKHLYKHELDFVTYYNTRRLPSRLFSIVVESAKTALKISLQYALPFLTSTLGFWCFVVVLPVQSTHF